jgi:uncharacterized glyoxalase superfamily protein PhnB
MTPATIIPYLLYEDLAAALEWLTRAFGFREILRHGGRTGNPPTRKCGSASTE